jgi:urease accessory protein UreF
MSLHETDFFPGLDLPTGYPAQRAPPVDQGPLQALERRVRELELARLNDWRLAGRETAAQRMETARQGRAIIDLCDRVKALEGRASGQEGTFEA